VPRTLLAVDDSATMRKVLEITFSGEDFQVVTAADQNGARSAMSQSPSVVVLDTSLDGDAYAFAKELRAKDSNVAIVLLASRHNAYDAAKGRDSGADDYMDKPFDTQQLIDKVKKAMHMREAGAPDRVRAATPPNPQPTQTTPSMMSPFATPAKPAPTPAATPNPAPVIPVAAASPVIAAKPVQVQRTHTLSFENTPAPAAITATKAVPAAPAGGLPAPRQPTPGPMPAGGATPAVSAAVNGQLAGKLEGLGLTPAQADAVLALSREVVERVVWEVVPQLAEAIIKEEITRLTKEG
jgi:CheY-like chemotaxis protein